MDRFDLVIFLIVVNAGFFLLILALFIYIIITKIIANRYEERKKAFFEKIENALIELLVNNDKKPISSALSNMKKHEYEMFVEFISVYLDNLKGEDFQKIAEMIYQEKIFHYLCESTRSSNTAVKLQAIYCLGFVKNFKIRRASKAFETDATRSEGETAALPVMQYLKQSMSDDNSFIRVIAIQAIAKMRDYETVEMVIAALAAEKMITFNKIAEILWEYGKEICPKLLEIIEKKSIDFNSPDNFTIGAAIVELFGIWQYLKAAPAILKILEGSRADKITISCINSLGKMVYTEALPAIEKFFDAKNPAVRVSCINAVYEFRAEEKIGALTLMLNDYDWTVRHAAATALLKMDFNFSEYMFSGGGQDLSRAYRTIAHVLTEKAIASEEAA